MPTQVPTLEIHDENARIVKGWGTVDVFDKVNERLPIDEFKRIMPVIMKRGGIVMNRHTNQPAGKILNYQFLMKDTPEGPREGVFLETEVYKDFGSDDEVWEGIKKGEIEGFSFGGKNNLEDVDFSKGVSKKTLKGLEGFEFSYVPKGCNQEATIEQINYIAKEDVEKEDGETSTDSDHYHLYSMDEAGNGQTLTTLPREADDHTHKIESGIVVLENAHSHELIRKLVKKEKVQKPFAGFADFAACEMANKDKDNPAAYCGFLQARVEKIDQEYDSEKNESKGDSTNEEDKKDNSDDKIEKESQSVDDLTLLHSDKKDESFIKNKVLNKNMAEEDEKNETKKIEEAPMAADSTPTEDPMSIMNAKLDKLIEILTTQAPVAKEKEEDKEEDKVEKEGDGEEVKLPESEGDEVAQDKPAEGAKPDEAKANFLEKEGIEKIKADVKKDIMKELQNNKADTPRPVAKANDNNIKKAEETKAPKNSMEANRMIKEAGLR